MNGLFDLLACPGCRRKVEKYSSGLYCAACDIHYPVIDGIPVMLPGGTVPETCPTGNLITRNGYDPWIPRLVLQSMLDNQIALDVGAGSMALDDPCIIRMDVTLTPYVDIVADLHALPFLPGSIDFIFSLAVFEHLKNPFRAVESILETLKMGGLVYHECNFVWPYHGYPNHYFNASKQGMESLFERFNVLKTGVAPYQMPSLALGSVIESFLSLSGIEDQPHGKKYGRLLRRAVERNSTSHDIYFTEETAHKLAAGVYYAGYKPDEMWRRSSGKTSGQNAADAGDASHSKEGFLPAAILNTWQQSESLQTRFPDPWDLTRVDNLLLWARNDGRRQYPDIDRYLQELQPFN
ncbi:MAG TPA: methyltransferase domain-containing protein, partial [bacterium]|nr:methyltransferase domain-containing protein [bacterium]